jgi:ubiquinone/menaquinone biosynthesis C-methylase UbiE
MSNKQHWENVYTTKQFTDVSWYQSVPVVSLDFISQFHVAKDSAIIDVGGGDSFFVDHLLKLGYTNITVVDIAAAAIERAKKRVGEKATNVNWVVSDITNYVPDRGFDFWHDRATFHFLTTAEQIDKYLDIAANAIAPNGKMVMGTFSEYGPEKCSGLPIKQYSEEKLTLLIKKWFQKIKCIHTDHLTPFNTIQHFLFCSFKKAIV